MMTYFIFFLSGAILHSLFSRFLGIVQASMAYHELEAQILTLLVALEDDMDAAAKLKAEHLKSSGIDPTKVDNILKTDSEVIQTWREIVLFKMMSSFPKGFWKLFKYETWAQARLYAKSLEKEE